jgi:hypothetical protein
MEPISAITISLALGAGATAGTEMVKTVVKDAYDKLKELIRSRYPKVSLEQLEHAPESDNRRAVVEEDLAKAGADKDPELLAAARKLTELIQQQAPGVAAAIGIDLKEIEAANLRLSDIAASGTGVRARRATIKGDVDIRGVRAGVRPGDILKDG